MNNTMEQYATKKELAEVFKSIIEANEILGKADGSLFEAISAALGRLFVGVIVLYILSILQISTIIYLLVTK